MLLLGGVSMRIPSRKKWKYVSKVIYNKQYWNILKDKYNMYVSEDGEIMKCHYNGKTKKSFGTIHSDGKGYKKRVIGLRVLTDEGNKKSISVPVHRIVACAYLGFPEDLDMITNHLDGNPLNNKSSNIEWVTNGENQLHAYENNLKRIFRGEDHQNAEIDEKTVKEIIIPMLLKGESDRTISKAIGNKVSSAMINRIRNKKSWKHITNDINIPSVNERKLLKLESHSNAKLTEEILNDTIIPLLLDNIGDTKITKALKERYNMKISRKTITKIRNHETWNNYTYKYTFPTQSKNKLD